MPGDAGFVARKTWVDEPSKAIVSKLLSSYSSIVKDSIRYENFERAVQWRVLADYTQRLRERNTGCLTIGGFMREGGVSHLLDASYICGADAVTGHAVFTENVNVYF
jgi:hypothetical protein